MEMYERIRELRKNYLNLSQTNFGNRLGVSRSVIKNIELNTLAKPEQKLSLIKLMCKEFNVNEEWLINGNGPIFIEATTFNLDEFVKSKGATETELEIIKTYFELEPDIRKATIDYLRKMFTIPIPSNDIASTSSSPKTKNPSIDEMVDDYRNQLELEAKATEKSEVSQESA